MALNSSHMLKKKKGFSSFVDRTIPLRLLVFLFLQVVRHLQDYVFLARFECGFS